MMMMNDNIVTVECASDSFFSVDKSFCESYNLMFFLMTCLINIILLLHVVA